MKPGLVSISFRALSPERIIECVVEAGLQGIEWGGDVHVPHGDVSRAAEVARLTRSAGLEVASYGSYYKFAECDPEADEPGPSMEAVLDTAEALGAPAIRVWAGRQGPLAVPPLVWQAIVMRARDFAEKAAARGMRLDFEFHENTLTETAESTLRLLWAVDHPAAQTLWQPPLQTAPELRLRGLRQVERWVSNLHCNHFAQDPWPEIHLLEEGEAEWENYLDALQHHEPERWILIEHVKDHAEASFVRDAAALRRWLMPHG